MCLCACVYACYPAYKCVCVCLLLVRVCMLVHICACLFDSVIDCLVICMRPMGGLCLSWLCACLCVRLCVFVCVCLCVFVVVRLVQVGYSGYMCVLLNVRICAYIEARADCVLVKAYLFVRVLLSAYV